MRLGGSFEERREKRKGEETDEDTCAWLSCYPEGGGRLEWQLSARVLDLGGRSRA